MEWTHRRTPGEAQSSIAWSGSQFVTVGWGVLTSPDGIAWKPSQVSDGWRFDGITWGGSLFVAVGHTVPLPESRALIVTSPDGVTWTERSTPTWVGDVAWSGDRFVAVGRSTILTSPDGVTWSEQGMPIEGGHLLKVTWGGSLFVAVGYIRDSGVSPGSHSPRRSLILTSPDGVTWTQQSAPGPSLGDVAWSGDRFVAVGNAILTSLDGVTWSEQRAPVGRHSLNGITWGGSQFVAVGSMFKPPASAGGQNIRSGLIMTSPDGITWTQRAAPTRSDPLDVAWSGTRFVAVGGLRRGWIATYTDVLILTSP